MYTSVNQKYFEQGYSFAPESQLHNYMASLHGIKVANPIYMDEIAQGESSRQTVVFKSHANIWFATQLAPCFTGKDNKLHDQS